MERLRASFMIPVPGRKGSGEVTGPSQLDRSGSQCVAPSDRAHVPAGEHHRIVDDHDQMFITAGVLLADLGVAPLDEQPVATARPRQGGVVEADKDPALRQPLTIQEEGRPHPQHDAGVGLLGGQVGPLRAPVLERLHHLRQLPTRFGGLIDRAGAIGFAPDLNHPSPLQLPQPLRQQTPGKAGRAVGDLVEVPATQDDDVAQDDDGPAFG